MTKTTPNLRWDVIKKLKKKNQQVEALKLIKEEKERKFMLSLNSTNFFFQTNSALLVKKPVMWTGD